MYTFYLEIRCIHLDWQVECATQIFGQLRTAFSAVELLTLGFWRPLSSETTSEADRTQWREFLGLFGSVKTLRINNDFPEQLSHSLQVRYGQPPLELLPELKQLEYSAKRVFINPFAAFADARRTAGRPVTMVRTRPKSRRTLSQGMP
jgi:hypothetical protein